MKEDYNDYRITALEKLLSYSLPDIYPIIENIKVTKNDAGLYILIYTNLPDEITGENYWTSDFADNDFSWMKAKWIPHYMKYLGFDQNEFMGLYVYVFKKNGEVIQKEW